MFYFVGRQFGLVWNKVRKDCPSIQLTALKERKKVALVLKCCDVIAVLACHWYGKVPICNLAVPCLVPQLCCLMLVKPTHFYSLNCIFLKIISV
ncbi:hypothetical protein GIB67_030227 [Kingdonia uniflora]|uniref:Uncharacterized protein n=1 Tax=Kingdonia uniflora TaxID=39325 RepID=A0A7J7MN41_9MAGN|nr:hypothetical protein GIB67_030227 [Kingdonia uniflora]